MLAVSAQIEPVKMTIKPVKLTTNIPITTLSKYVMFACLVMCPCLHVPNTR